MTIFRSTVIIFWMCYLTRRRLAWWLQQSSLSLVIFDMSCCSVFIHTDKQEKIVSEWAGDRDMKACMSLNLRTLGNYRTWLEFLDTFIIAVTLVQIFSLSSSSGRTGSSAGWCDLVLVSNSNCETWTKEAIKVMLCHRNHVQSSKSIIHLQRSFMRHCHTMD